MAAGGGCRVGLSVAGDVRCEVLVLDNVDVVELLDSLFPSLPLLAGRRAHLR
jgi:hypothetical protein